MKEDHGKHPTEAELTEMAEAAAAVGPLPPITAKLWLGRLVYYVRLYSRTIGGLTELKDSYLEERDDLAERLRKVRERALLGTSSHSAAITVLDDIAKISRPCVSPQRQDGTERK